MAAAAARIARSGVGLRRRLLRAGVGTDPGQHGLQRRLLRMHLQLRGGGLPGNASGSIVNTCGSDPEPHCHSECNAPADNGCGDMTCDDGQTLDVDTCTCLDANGAAVDGCGGAKFSTDPNNCGACGVVCGPTMNCFEASCVDVCAPNGLIACGATCINPLVDPINCGGSPCIGRSALGTCANGQCI